MAGARPEGQRSNKGDVATSIALFVVLFATLAALFAPTAGASPDPRFSFEFGKEGTENGQFSSPSGIATDSEGNIWVVDTGNNRVQKFNSKGEYLSQFGKEGAGNGEFKAPSAIAINSSGNIWVVDTGNNRVQKFNSKGEYLSQFGKEGAGNGEFKAPSGIAIAASGSIFVADTGNNRVQKFDGTGKYLSQVGKEGTGNGEFKAPSGIAIESSNLFVTDSGNNRVQKFGASSLKYVSQFGKAGAGNGEFKSPSGITTDFQGRLWVTDSGNNRAQKFDTEGNYLDQFGSEGSEAGQLSGPSGIATPAAQKVLVVDRGNHRVESWTVKAEAPAVITQNAIEIKIESATLKALVNPEALSTTYYFEYGKTESYGTKIPVTPASVGSGSSNVAVSQTPTGLSQGTTYYFRAVAESSAGTTYGANKTLKTLKLPTGKTEPPTNVKATSATLNGMVNPEGSATTYYFEYGTSTSYGTKIPTTPASIGSGSSNVAVSQTPTGLSQGTTYHYRVVAESVAGTVPGADETLTTLKAPKATTEEATEVKGTSATLNGTVNPEGSATSYYFEYGKTETYGTKIPVSAESVGSGTSDVAVSQTPTGLTPDADYYYRLVAEGTDAGVTTKGAGKTLHTLKAPKATTEEATEVKGTSATLNGTVNPEGSATSYYFEYGKTTSYGTQIPVSAESVGSGTSDVAVSQTPTGLALGTTYNYRLVADNGVDKIKGANKTLTTLKAPKATTEEATEIKGTAATLNGTVNPEGSATSYYFEYGETTSYGTKVPVSAESVGSGTSDVEVHQVAGGLSTEVPYHYRIVASSAVDTTYGKDQTFVPAIRSTLCSQNESPYCAASNSYAGETAIGAEAAAPIVISTSLATIECSKSLLSGETAASSGKPLPIAFSSWTLEECATTGKTNNCTMSAEEVGKSAWLSWTSGSDGTLTWSGGENALMWHTHCVNIPFVGTLDCTYSLQFSGTVEGGSPARLTVPNTTLGKAGGTSCPATSSLEGTYNLTSPKPVYVALVEQ